MAAIMHQTDLELITQQQFSHVSHLSPLNS